MNFDLTLDFGNILALIIFLIGGVTVWYNTQAKVKENTKSIESHERELESHRVTLAKALDRAEEIRARTAHELAEYKLHVAKEYATIPLLAKVEERVVQAIDRLGDRLDKFFDRAKDRE